MKYLLAIVLLNFVVFAYTRQPCNKRDLGNNRIVCVCNVTHCDDLDALEKTAKGVVTVFETSRSGDRLEKTQLNFGTESIGGSNLAQTLTIDRSKKVQKIIGFGGSFTDSTGYNIKSLPTALEQHLVSDYFSDKGLEFNLARVPIGGSDFSTHAYSYDDNHKDDFDLQYFSLTDDDHNYKIPFMKDAVKVSPRKVKFFGSPWAPPAWMKNNSELIHGGYLNGEPGGKYYKAFAHYFVKFLDAYKAQGLPMWGLTIENEPKAGGDKTYGFNCMGFTPELQRDFIKQDLGPVLEAAGYGRNVLDVMIFDDQRSQILRWASIILKDSGAAKYVAGTAVHWYEDTLENAGELDKTIAVDPSKYIINTESSNCCHDVGDWSNAESYAKDIIIDLNHQVSGYCAWNMVLDMVGGPRWCGGKADAPIAVDAHKQEYYKQPSFYSLGHFSKFILPDSVKIQLNTDNNLNNVFSVAFERPDGAVVVVVLNQNDDQLDLTLKESNNHLTHTVKPHAIQTFIYY